MTQVDIKTALLESALNYAALGWCVIPIAPQGKTPLIRDWPKQASCDPDQIAGWWHQWPDANVGIVTGQLSGLFVLDVDPKNDGFTTLDLLIDKHGALPDTPTVRTGSGGQHVYFRYPSGITIRNSASKLGPGLDIRAEGGFVVAPPSIHPTGREYLWLDDQDWSTPLADPPQWLLDLLVTRPAPGGNGHQQQAQNSKVPAGQRNVYLTSRAGQLRRLGLDEAAIYAVLLIENRDLCDPPLDESEVATIARSVSRYAPVKSGWSTWTQDVLNILRIKQTFYLFGRSLARVEFVKLRHGQPDVWLNRCTEKHIAELLVNSSDDSALVSHANRLAALVLAKPLSEIQQYLDTIEVVSAVPLVSPDGEILSTAGFHDGVYITQGTQLPEPPATLRECVEALLEPFCDFPFTGEADRANLLAMILTPLLRLCFDSRPLFLIEAAKEGTGKTLLVQAAMSILFGNVSASSAPESDEEWRKRITAAVSEGWPLLFVDNLRTKLDSSSLASLLTSPRWSDRILGESTLGDWPNYVTVVLTGNNVQTSGEIARRIVPIRLEADCECPEDRTGFRHPDLLRYVREKRLELLSAALRMVGAWFAAGRPGPSAEVPDFGSYEQWRRTIGGILQHAGVTGFLGNLGERKDDLAEDRQAWRGFVQAWYDTYQSNFVSAGALLPLAEPYGLVPDAATDAGRQRRFGHVLTRHKGQVYGAYKIIRRANQSDYWLKVMSDQ